MNNNEKIQRAEQLIAEANALLNEVKATHDNEEDVLSVYKSAINEQAYWLNNDGGIDHCSGLVFDEKDKHPYCNYPSSEYAEQAQKIKDFNDKLLAFKWCYDRDFKPVFSDDYSNRAYFVDYDSEDKEYQCDWDNISNRNVVYFSSEEIAQKCCDWLNSFKEAES